jgi:phosphoglycerol transferase
MSVNFPLSVVLATSAILLFVISNPQRTRPAFRLVFLAGFFLFLTGSVAHLVADFFTNRGIDESVVFHLIYGLKGAGFSEYSTLIILGFVALLISVALVFGIKKIGEFGVRSSWFLYLSIAILTLSIMVHPITNVFISHPTALTFAEKFEDYYREPVVNQRVKGNHKNLVFIYAEGLERTWLDEELFPGITPDLKKLRESAVDFSNISQMPYTGWTIAGIVASQCGIPLVIPSHGNGMSGTDMFLPGVACIGDLLKANGYQSEFYGGANLEFAGKGNFFKTHGFTSVNGIKELKEFAKQENLSGWGLRDDDLLEIAYHRFIELSASEQPFALLTLTLDTHHPTGIPSNSCTNRDWLPKASKTPMHFAVRCSDYLISRFIGKIRQSPYSEQTLVVLVSDHLAMKNAASTILDKAERKELFMILPGWTDSQKQINTPGSIFDVGATTMAFLGFQMPIGFGRNLLKDKTLFADNPHTNELFRFWSRYFNAFWEFPNLEDGITNKPLEGALKIGDTTIRTPVLIQFDSDLDTQLVFDGFAGDEIGILDTTYRGLAIGTPFAYVAGCRKFSEAKHTQQGKETCLLLGRKGGENIKLIYLKDSLRVDKEEFIKVIEQPEPFVL